MFHNKNINITIHFVPSSSEEYNFQTSVGRGHELIKESIRSDFQVMALCDKKVIRSIWLDYECIN